MVDIDGVAVQKGLEVVETTSRCRSAEGSEKNRESRQVEE